MMPYRLKRFLLSPTELHVFCALAALLCCIPAIFPEVCPEGWVEGIRFYAGSGLMTAVIASFSFMILAGLIHLSRLNNIKAFGQLMRWALVWGADFGFFVLIALAADVSSPDDEGEAMPIQITDTLFQPHDALTGPEALIIPLETEGRNTEHLAAVPHLNKLENEHPDLLRAYLEQSPRWQSGQNDDMFYSKPGHPVMVPPTLSGTPGLLHVCFRRLTEGAPLPVGYMLLHPGDPFPETPADARHPQTDFAIDLGRNHYLLLAWRGTAHTETTRKAINAAISAIDERMQPLAEQPEEATVQRMLRGRISYAGNTPEIRLAEIPGQSGTYQSEVYANPGEPGTLLFFIRSMEDNQTLRLFHCPAKYSGNKEELFRHNFPCDIPQWQRENYASRTNGKLTKDSPVFIVGVGHDNRTFGAALEVWFKPADSHRSRVLLLRRCYRMQFCDDTASPATREGEDERRIDQDEMTVEAALQSEPPAAERAEQETPAGCEETPEAPAEPAEPAAPAQSVEPEPTTEETPTEPDEEKPAEGTPTAQETEPPAETSSAPVSES